jgi:hypothetical protein
MVSYQLKFWKFCGGEDSVQWLEDYISEIEGPRGPEARMEHVFFSECLEGATLGWYCNVLEYKPKVYWDLLPAAFSSHWNLFTCDVHTVKVLLNLTPLDNICQPLTACILPTVDCTANMTLNWATDVDKSIGSVSVISSMVNSALLMPIIDVT